MQRHQIGAVVLRHFRQFFGDTNIFLQMLFWPLVDTFVWGFLGLWIQGMQDSAGDVQLTVMLSIFLWRASSNAGVLTGVSLFEELTANNLINMFASPLRLKNWLIGTFIFSSLVAFCINVFYVTPFVWLMHGGSYMAALQIIKCFLIFVLPMIMSGLCLGTIALSVVITLGKRANELIHIIVWFLAPFTTAYYPPEVLPKWGQAISQGLPFMHILQAMREYVLHGVNPAMGILKGACLALFYGLICVSIFYRAFQRSRIKGLARLSD